VARIFVIDDDAQLLRMVGLMLERGGHTTTLINDPRNGLEQLKAEKPDLLVLDVMMPDMSGHDLTRQIRDTSEIKDLPILILTARSQEIDRDTALESGANGYLSKPVTSQELIKQVDDLLTKKPTAEEPSDSIPGMVLSVFGLRGGVGKTTLAINLALALRRVSQREVCLVDLSPSGSQAILHVHLQPASSWITSMSDDVQDWLSLKGHLTIHPTGLRVLAAPITPSTEPLSAAFTKRLIDLLRDNMMFTVLDLPPVLSPSFLAALEETDVGLHVITPDVVSVRTAVQTQKAIAKAGINLKQKSFVLNQIASKAQVPAPTVERILNSRIPFQIEYDPNQINALSQGTPLVLALSDSPLPTIVNRMADVVWKRVATKAGLL
jgi:pilus assembly protein CpaE